MRVSYIRVSTVEQNEQRQLAAMEGHDIEKVFSEKLSAKTTDRPELQNMLNFVREGDEIFVHDFSRLARSTEDLLKITRMCEEKDVRLISLKENLDTKTPTGKLMLTMIAAINEFERENLLERQREGIAIAKAEGKYKGRQVKAIDDKTWERLYGEYQRREITKTKLAELLHVSRPTLNKLIEERATNK